MGDFTPPTPLVPAGPGFPPVLAISNELDAAGVSGVNNAGGTGVHGKGAIAGKFEGNVSVTGDVACHDVMISGGQDCAENFDISDTEQGEPGTVMVIDQSGVLRQSQQAYDKRVAGVVSGAGDLRPGILLGSQVGGGRRIPIALIGKVYCKVDAQHSPIEVGDLLTTSPTLGHAMKVTSPHKAFGSVLGKALQPLREGQGIIRILVTLQ